MDLVQAGRFTEEEAREYLEKIRWPDGPKCPHCSGMNVTRLAGEKARPGTIQCNSCREQFTVTVGTVMEDSHLPLHKWVLAFHLMASSKKGVSALQLKRQLGIGSYQTAWHLCHRIRHAMKKHPDAPMLQGVVEADETYVGGRARGKRSAGRSLKNKTPVVALVERGGNIKVKPVARVTKKNLRKALQEGIDPSATVMTDDFASYRGLEKVFAGHKIIKHSEGVYSQGGVNTNTVESFFSLLKRGVYGSFHHVSKRHLHRYCDEFGFRWDHRKIEDAERTEAAIQGAEGKRLMYAKPHNLKAS